MKPCENTAYADPIILDLLSEGSIRCISALPNMTRVEKTALISDWEIAKRHLDVCVAITHDGKNCSECSKCARTLLTLELLGKAENFSGLFDIEKYELIKQQYLATLIRQPNYVFNREIIQLAIERNIRLVSPASHLIILTKKYLSPIKQMIRSRL
jgi:hypothetical protein